MTLTIDFATGPVFSQDPLPGSPAGLTRTRARFIAKLAWEQARDHSATIKNRVPQTEADAENLISQVASALMSMAVHARTLPAPSYIANRLPDSYGMPAAYGGIYLRESYGIPERKDSAAKIMRLALVLAGLVTVKTRSDEVVSNAFAIERWWDLSRQADGFLLFLLPTR